VTPGQQQNHQTSVSIVMFEAILMFGLIESESWLQRGQGLKIRCQAGNWRVPTQVRCGRRQKFEAQTWIESLDLDWHFLKILCQLYLNMMNQVTIEKAEK
jgi:hypothetical protein